MGGFHSDHRKKAVESTFILKGHLCLKLTWSVPRVLRKSMHAGSFFCCTYKHVRAARDRLVERDHVAFTNTLRQWYVK